MPQSQLLSKQTLNNAVDTKAMVALLKARNTFTLSDFYTVYVRDTPIGFAHRVHKDDIVSLHHCIRYTEERILIDPDCTSYAALTQLFHAFNETLVQKGLLTPSHAGEMYRVTTDRFSESIFEIARYAAPFWGIRIFGVHMNGLLQGEAGQVDMWYAQRSKNRSAPGKLDHLVCGGQPAAITFLENLCKEAYEEAKMPPELASRAVPVGIVSCWEQEGYYLCRYTPVMFDLWLPDAFKPVNGDGSVSAFATLPVAALAQHPETLLDFKAACHPVLISMLVRHGYITPDDPNYIDICTLLLKGFFP